MSKMPCWILLTALATLSVGEGWGAEHFTWRKKLGGSPYSVGVNPLNPNSVYAQSGTNILVSYNRGNTWVVLGNPHVSQVRQIIVHPADTNVIFCAAFSGGIQRSSDYGATWFTVLENYGIDGESITYDPYHPDTMYAGNFFNAQIFRSTDRGLYWNSVGFAGDDDICALAIRPDSANILLGGTGGGTISKSTDGGATWYIVKEGGSEEIPRIVVSETNPMILYATGFAGAESATGIWKSTDGGEHWFRTALHASVWAVDIDYTNPDIVYAGTFGLNNYAAVFRSTNGGATWDTLVSGFPPDGDAWCIKVHPTDPSKVWLALSGFQVGGLLRWVGTETLLQGAVLDTATGDTVRNGWLSVLQTGDSVNLNETAGRFAIGYFDGDTSLTPTLRVLSYPYYVQGGQFGFVPDSSVTQNILLHELERSSIDGTVRGSISQQPVSAHLNLFASILNATVVIEDSTDPDGSFTLENLYISHPPIVRYSGLTIQPSFPYGQEHVASLVLDTSGITLARLVDTADVMITGSPSGGAVSGTFASLLDSLGFSFYYWDPVRFGQALLSSANLLRKRSVLYSTATLDSALTATELDSLSGCLGNGVNLFISGRNFVERNDSSDFLLNRAYTVFAANATVNSCRGVQNDLLTGVSSFTIASSAPRDSMYVISSDAHPVLEYELRGPLGTAAVRVDGDSGIGKLILMGFPFEAIVFPAMRGAILQRVVGYFDGSIVVGVDEGAAHPASEFQLKQNYPNPFNPTTTLEFQIPKSEFITLKVYNILGEEVRTLMNERKDAGSYSVIFNSHGLPSGVYVYRLRAGDFTEAAKMILLK